MNKFHINSTDNTPEVTLDVQKQKFIIKGVCAPENPKEFFKPIQHELETVKSSLSNLEVDIFLEYFNTGSSKCLLNLFLLIISKEISTIKYDFNWYFESGDEELMESGQIFEELIGIKFNYKNIN